MDAMNTEPACECGVNCGVVSTAMTDNQVKSCTCGKVGADTPSVEPAYTAFRGPDGGHETDALSYLVGPPARKRYQASENARVRKLMDQAFDPAIERDLA